MIESKMVEGIGILFKFRVERDGGGNGLIV